MRVAVIHYWLTGMRGGERVLEQILACHPDADLFTHVYDPAAVSPTISERRVRETFVGRLPFARSRYPFYLGFMPRALEELDLSGYDLVISSESGPAKGVIAPPEATHLCYVHSPMRYLYDEYPAYRRSLGPLGRAYFSHLAHRLRQWDIASAARVDRFVANSGFVAERVRRCYGRAARVVHPPVDLAAFAPPGPGDPPREGYLLLGELVPYKRADLAVAAFAASGRRLRVVGDGPEARRLRAGAPPNVTFEGRVPAAALPGLYRRARALVFPGREDFGIVPLEAMACGAPVIAYGRGGALDTVVEGETGLFFHEQTVEALNAALDAFERRAFDTGRVARRALAFAPARFRAAFRAEVEAACAHRRRRAAR